MEGPYPLGVPDAPSPEDVAVPAHSPERPCPLPDDPLPARRVEGPTGLSGDVRRSWNLARTLAATDWKVRFFGSALGYVWSLLRPLLLFALLWFVFSEVIGADVGVQDYGVMLLVGILCYFYFSEVTGSALTAMVDREALIRKVGFPRVVVPLSVLLVATLNLGLYLVVLAVFVLATGVEPRWSWLALPLPLVALAGFAGGLGLLFSALYVRYRDMRPIWEVLLQATFYATPILYPITLLAERFPKLAQVAMANPLAAVVQELRHLLLGPASPSASQAIGGGVLILIPLAILVVVVGLGLWVFERMAPVAADEL